MENRGGVGLKVDEPMNLLLRQAGTFHVAGLFQQPHVGKQGLQPCQVTADLHDGNRLGFFDLAADVRVRKRARNDG